MKRFRILLVTTAIFSLSATKSISQETARDSNTVVERHKIGVKNAARTAEFFEARTYVNNRNDTLLYRLLKPINHDPNKMYPLVLCLSGSGGRGSDNIAQIAGCWPAQILSKQENREKYPAFLLVPQCPPESNWGRTLRKSENKSPDQPSVDSLVFEIINALENEFKIDKKRRYVTGQSMGGYGSWHFILTRPHMFAAAIPICGGGNPVLARNIVDTPIWVFHGQKDSGVPVELSRNMVEAIRELGGNPRYNEFPDTGHVCWPLAYDTPGLLDWLFTQKLN